MANVEAAVQPLPTPSAITAGLAKPQAEYHPAWIALLPAFEETQEKLLAASDAGADRELVLSALDQAKDILESMGDDPVNQSLARAMLRDVQSVHDAVKTSRGPIPRSMLQRVNGCLADVSRAAVEASTKIARAHAAEKACIADAADDAAKSKPTLLQQVVENPVKAVTALMGGENNNITIKVGEREPLVERSGIVAAVVGIIPKPIRRAIKKAADDTVDVSRSAGYATSRGTGLLDAKGEATARDIDKREREATTEEEKKYWSQERLDAVSRRMAGRTFIGQEIDAAIGNIKDAGFGKDLKVAWNGYGTDDVMQALIKNGAFTEGYKFGVGDDAHQANSQWSDRNVHRIDQDGDGQLSSREIITALRDPNAAKAAAAATARYTQAIQNSMGKLGPLDKKFDRNGDGVFTAQEISLTLRRQGVTNIASIDTADELRAVVGQAPLKDPKTREQDTRQLKLDISIAQTPFGKALDKQLGDLSANKKYAAFYDTDKDGKVELHEVRDLLAKRGITNLSQIDLDRNGVSAPEIYAAVTKHKPAPAKK